MVLPTPGSQVGRLVHQRLGEAHGLALSYRGSCCLVCDDMALVIRPGSGFPFAIILEDEAVLGTGHTWSSVADWCSLLIGPLDQWWTLDWQDETGMTWGFTRREDALFFAFTWQQTKKDQNQR